MGGRWVAENPWETQTHPPPPTLCAPAGRPEKDRTYLIPAAPAPAASAPHSGSPTPQDPAAAPPLPAGAPLPALPCPFACGLAHLPEGYEFAAHLVLGHLPELQTLAAALDSLALKVGPGAPLAAAPPGAHPRPDALAGVCKQRVPL